MSFPVVVILYPLLMAVLCVGTGLLIERVLGTSLPAALVPVLGYCALVVVSQFTVLSSSLAPWTPEILAAVTIAGYAWDRGSIVTRWRRATTNRWWLPLAVFATYLTVAAPLIFAGHLTFPGYLLDTTAGIHLAGAEYLLHHGYSLPPATPTYGAALHAYYGTGYPSGGQVLMAASGWLSGQDLVWLYFPFQVIALCLTALGLSFLAAQAGLARWAAAISGWIAAVPALVTAYAMMGSIKEISALPALVLLGGVVVAARHGRRSPFRDVVPFGFAAAAAVASIGLPALAWIALAALGLVARSLPDPALWRRSPLATARAAVIQSAVGLAALVATVVALSIPTMTRIAASLSLASNLSASNNGFANDPGNLLQPLRFVQVFGVWLGGSHRIDPKYLNQTYLLIGIVVVAVALGVVALLRRRAFPLLFWLAATCLVWLVLYERGTEWTDAKVMMLSSPLIVLVAMRGAFGDLQRQRSQGLLLAAILGFGVLASDALLYHSTTLAPLARFSELRTIGRHFAGQGPTLVPDFDEYAIYLLRKLEIDGPGFAPDMRQGYELIPGGLGGGIGYGHSYDVDQLVPSFVQSDRLIVMRRSPRWSRPPSNFRLVWQGRYYEVWRRIGSAPRLHIAAGGEFQPVAPLPCRQLRVIARRARAVGRDLLYAERPPVAAANLALAGRSPTVAVVPDASGLPEALFLGPGTVSTAVQVTADGMYRLWIGGILDRPLHISIDGHPVAAPSSQAGGDGNMIDVGLVSLTRGRHAVTLVRGGGGVRPGDSIVPQAYVDGVYLERSSNAQELVQTMPAARWRTLCDRPLDWLEIG